MTRITLLVALLSLAIVGCGDDKTSTTPSKSASEMFDDQPIPKQKAKGKANPG